MPEIIPKKLAIWVPLARETGLGHFYRTMGIYEAFPGSFYFTDKPAELKLSHPLRMETLPKGEDLLGYLKKKNTGLLYIDNYFIDRQTLSLLSKQKEIPIAYFDAKFEAPDFTCLINSNPFAKEKKYPKSRPGASHFLGSEYYCFRQEIRDCQKNQKNKNTIFICIGGTDSHSLTLQLLGKLSPSYNYEIILGKGSGEDYFRAVEEKAKELKLKARCHFDPPDFFALLASSESAILSCSTLVYEAIFLQVPFFCIQTVDNQTQLASYLKANGVTVLGIEDVARSPEFPGSIQAKLAAIQFESKKDELFAQLKNYLT
jgi:UDP-2,4-diacetamido-2,4,6-trideoxy-beta-L-altropyranose hydrolase